MTFWGGEPLLEPALLREVVAYATRAAGARGQRVTFSMPTNGTLLDAETAAWLADARVRIFVSMDGDAAAQAGRPLAGGASSSPAALRGLRHAVEAGSGTVRMTVTPQNAERQAENAAYLLSHGARELLLYPVLDAPWSTAELAAFARGQRALAELLGRAVEGARAPEEIPRLRPWRGMLRKLLEGGPPRPRRGPLGGCGAGTELVAADAGGTLVPCHRFVFYNRRRPPGLVLGDLERGLDLEACRPLSSLRLEELRGGEAGEQPCTHCDDYDLCPFGCPAVSFATTGSLTRVPPHACSLARIQVAVCRDLHARLGTHPLFALALGRPLRESLRAAARGLGLRAQALYSGGS